MKINPTKTINELISVLAYVNDLEENRKIYHTYRVSILSALFARRHLTPRRQKEVFYAALLHDVGAVGLPYHIIHYLKRNDRESRNILLSHPIVGAELVSNIPPLTGVAKLILDHHEWINGQGYPRGKIKKDIPLGSQLIRISDSIDIAIQTGRFKTLSALKNYLSLNIDKEYSPVIFKCAFELLKEKRLFYKICKAANLEGLFQKIREKIGFITVPRRIDAIGTALEVIAQIIDMKHPYTSGHSLRVSRYAMAIALALNLKHDEITKVKWTGLIHDIGKLRIPRSILDKPANLTAKEFEMVKKHAHLTEKILNMISTLKEIAPAASAHHEHFDGSGYPLGLKGAEIPLDARILAVCDAFDAMTSNRPYRKTLTPELACKELEKYAGVQFDPGIVKEAVPLFKNLGL